MISDAEPGSPEQSIIVDAVSGMDKVIVIPPGDCYDPDVVVCVGKKVAEKTLGRKVNMTNEVATPIRWGDSVYVIQHDADKVLSGLRKKGGQYEKMFQEWVDIWQMAEDLNDNGLSEPPRVLEVTRARDIVKLLQKVRQVKGFVGYDYETNALRPELDREGVRVVCVGLGWQASTGECVAASFPVDYPGHFNEHDQLWVVNEWITTLRYIRGVAHNAKYEQKINISRFKADKYLSCSLLADAMLNELVSHQLHHVMRRHGVPWFHYKAEADAIRRDPMKADLSSVLQYCGLDALGCLLAYKSSRRQLQEQGMLHILEVEERASMVLASMEMSGLQLDRKVYKELKKEVRAEARRTWEMLQNSPEVQRTKRWAVKNIKSFKPGDEYNPKSPIQNAYLIEKVLHINPGKTTKTKGKRFDANALRPYKDNPIISLITESRSYSSMLTGFLDKWGEYISDDFRLHGQFNQAKTVTGRLASTDPNLQNVPEHTETGRQIRKAFISRFPGGWLVSSDYRQQEPRLVAGVSGDEKLISAIEGGLDTHRYAASEIFGTDYEDIGDWERFVGKRMNLGIIYGQTEYGLAEQTQMKVDDARRLLGVYDERFSGVAQWKNEVHRFAIEHGYVEDLFGSRRHFPGIIVADKWQKKRMLRQASNFVIQRTAYMMVMIALVYLHAEVGRGMAEVVAQIHDSFITDCMNPVKVIPAIVGAMEIHNSKSYWRDKRVPMKTDIKIGRDLYRMTEVQEPFGADQIKEAMEKHDGEKS